MKRTIKYLAIVSFIVLGLWGCYLLTFCDYKSYFIIIGENNGKFKFSDSLSLDTKLTIEDHVSDGNQIMAAYISFAAPSDSIKIQFLKVNVLCIDNPKQIIRMSHVITYVDPLIPENIDYVSAKQFDSLPEHYKNVTLKRQPWTTFRFYFETKNIDLGTIYSYQVVGQMVYKGKTVSFSKKIQVKRRKHFTDYQMMT